MLSKRSFLFQCVWTFWTSPIKVHLGTSLNSSDSTCSGPGLQKEKSIYLYIFCFMFSPSTVSSLWINKNIKKAVHPSSNFDEGGFHLSSFSSGFFGTLKEWWQLERKVWDLRLRCFEGRIPLAKDGLTSTCLHLPPPTSTYPRKFQGP